MSRKVEDISYQIWDIPKISEVSPSAWYIVERTTDACDIIVGTGDFDIHEEIPGETHEETIERFIRYIISSDMDHSEWLMAMNALLSCAVLLKWVSIYSSLILYTKKTCYQSNLSQEDRVAYLMLLHGVFQKNPDLQEHVVAYIKNNISLQAGQKYAEQLDTISFHLFLLDIFDNTDLTRETIQRIYISDDRDMDKGTIITKLLSSYVTKLTKDLGILETKTTLALFHQLCDAVDQLIRIRSLKDMSYNYGIISDKFWHREKNLDLLTNLTLSIRNVIQELSNVEQTTKVADTKTMLIDKEKRLNILYKYVLFRQQSSIDGYKKQNDELISSIRDAYFSLEKCTPVPGDVEAFVNTVIMPQVDAFLSQSESQDFSRCAAIAAWNASFIQLQTWLGILSISKYNSEEGFQEHVHERIQALKEIFIKLYNVRLKKDETMPNDTIQVFTHFVSQMGNVSEMKFLLPPVDHIIRSHGPVLSHEYNSFCDFLEAITTNDKFEDTVNEQFRITIIQMLLDTIPFPPTSLLNHVQGYVDRNNTNPDLLFQYGRLYKQLSKLYPDDRAEICFHTYLATIGISSEDYEKITTPASEIILKKLELSSAKGFRNWYKLISTQATQHMYRDIIGLTSSSFEDIGEINQEVCRIISTSDTFKGMCQIYISMDGKVPERTMGYDCQSHPILSADGPVMHFIYPRSIRKFINIGVQEMIGNNGVVGVFDAIDRLMKFKQLEYKEYTNSTTKLPNKLALYRENMKWPGLKEEKYFLMIDVNIFSPGFLERMYSKNMKHEWETGKTLKDLVNVTSILITRKLKNIVDTIPGARLYHLNFSLLGITFPCSKIIDGERMSYYTQEQLERYKKVFMEAIEGQVYTDHLPVSDRANFQLRLYPVASDIVSSEGNRDVYEKARSPDENGKRSAIDINRELADSYFNQVKSWDSLWKFEKDMSRWNTINNAIENNLIEDYYQVKKYHPDSNIPDSYECLMRMSDNEGNILTPDKFLDAATQWGMLPLLTDKLLLRLWDFMTKCSANISFNMCTANLKDPGFTARIEHMLILHSLHGSRLTIEILETVTKKDMITYAHVFQELEKLGCKFHIDDWGTDDSNADKLNILHNILENGVKGTAIKIDQGFVRKVSKDGAAVSPGMLTLASCHEAFKKAINLARTDPSIEATAIKIMESYAEQLHDCTMDNKSLPIFIERVNKSFVNIQHHKVVKTLCKEFSTMSGNTILVNSAIDLARKLGMEVVVEWVESREIESYLREYAQGKDNENQVILSCQGFYLWRPISAKELLVQLSNTSDRSQEKTRWNVSCTLNLVSTSFEI